MFLLWLDKGHDDHKGLTLETDPYDVAKNYMQFLMVRFNFEEVLTLKKSSNLHQSKLKLKLKIQEVGSRY